MLKLLPIFLIVLLCPEAYSQSESSDVADLKKIVGLQQAQIAALAARQAELDGTGKCLSAVVQAIQDDNALIKTLTDRVNTRFKQSHVGLGKPKLMQDRDKAINRNHKWGPNNVHRGFQWECPKEDPIQVGARFWYSDNYPSKGVVDRIMCRSLGYNRGQVISAPEVPESVQNVIAACQ